GNVQRNPQRCPWARHFDRSGRLDANASHSHLHYAGFDSGDASDGGHGRADQLPAGATRAMF
ncbi:hypothetical protein, partial [Burkholderia ubonensis]|uniref:hypothetical protein n=1 Tax=Burkholderia ubonensis TaxID=101571 RepID=UPI001C431857